MEGADFGTKLRWSFVDCLKSLVALKELLVVAADFDKLRDASSPDNTIKVFLHVGPFESLFMAYVLLPDLLELILDHVHREFRPLALVFQVCQAMVIAGFRRI